MKHPHSPSSSFPYRRVLVIGCPGGGKSTFSRALHAATGLPLHHLDMMYWTSDRTTVTRETFLTRLQTVLDTDSWIIDGNYSSTMEQRMKTCDVVFFLDYPVEVCLEGIAARRGQVRSDMPWVEWEDDPEFLDFVKRFPTEERLKILDLLKKFPDMSVLHFTSRAEADGYLASLR